MSGWRGVLVAALLLWVGAALQGAVAPRMTILNAQPDFLLIFLSLMGLYSSTAGSTVLGFSAGVVMGAIAGANLGAYAVSRSLAGFVDGWVGTIGFHPNAFWAAVNAALVTVVAQILLMFFSAPKSGITAFLAATIASAVYNGVLAMPAFLLLRRVLSPRGT